MEFDRWPLIYAAIQQHLQKIYNGKKVALKDRHWIPDSDGTYDLERIRLSRPSHISEMKSSATREYPSLIHTFFLTHTVNGVFLNPEDKALYDEMLRLQGLGSNTETGVPYTEDEIMAIVRGGKQRGHILGVGRVLPGQGTLIPPPPLCTHSSDVVKLKKREKVLTRLVNMFMKLFRSDDKFSQMLTQLESQPEIDGGSGSGGRGDDDQGDDEYDDEDGEDENDKLVILVNIDLYLADNASFVTSLTEGDARKKLTKACDGLKAYNMTIEKVEETGRLFLLHKTPEVSLRSRRPGHTAGLILVTRVKLVNPISIFKLISLLLVCKLDCSAHQQFVVSYVQAYMPHLSILYGDLTEEEKKRAQEKANALNESIQILNFPITRLALYKTDPEDKTLKS
ncbi:S-adenosyl-L-methionine-dependent methyltransferases superfamily protein [Tanacetum coccineum]